jgi:hypothetical protein
MEAKEQTIILHPTLAHQISAAINSRSVACDMIDVTLKRRPYDHDAFLFWVKHHRDASNRLIAMGIDVITYNEQLTKEQRS